MACCQFWPRLMLPCVVSWPQWVNGNSALALIKTHWYLVTLISAWSPFQTFIPFKSLYPMPMAFKYPRNHSGYGGLSHWEAMLHCNIISQWLSPCPEWSQYLISGPFHQWFFNHILNSISSHPYSHHMNAPKFCPWHNNHVALTCKNCCNLIIRNWITPKWNFHRIWIVSEKLLVTWFPGSIAGFLISGSLLISNQLLLIPDQGSIKHSWI